MKCGCNPPPSPRPLGHPGTLLYSGRPKGSLTSFSLITLLEQAFVEQLPLAIGLEGNPGTACNCRFSLSRVTTSIVALFDASNHVKLRQAKLLL